MPTDPGGWWETERAKLIRGRIAALTKPGDCVLDIGCGRGLMLDDPRLGDRLAVKVDPVVWSDWSGQPGLHVCADADALPFRDGCFDLVGSFDVLEHMVDDRRALAEQCRVVTSGGRVVTSVPADPRLWSAHDVSVGHHRRYTPSTLLELAASASLEPVHSSHFYSFLWPPAWLLRRRATRTAEPASGDSLVDRVVRTVISVVCGMERRIVDRFGLPLGTSLWMESRPR